MFVKNGVVTKIIGFHQINVASDETPILTHNDTVVGVNYTYLNGVFSPGVKQDEFELAETKKKEFLSSIGNVKTLDELKAAIAAAAADADINKP